MNIDRPSFWFGVIVGLLVAALIFDLCQLADRHIIFVR